MDAHRVLRDVYYRFGFDKLPQQYYIYFGLSITLIYLISYIINKDENLIKNASFRQKMKSLEALSYQLCANSEESKEEIEKIKQRIEIFSKQTAFRLDMQNAEQKKITDLITNLKEEIEQFYE